MSGAEGQGPEKGQSSKAGAADKGQASKTGALKRQYQFRHSESDSDSDGSEDSFSAPGISNNSGKNNDAASAVGLKTPGKGRAKGRKARSHRHEWEIIEGLKDGQKCEQKPDKYEGFLSKRKRWPMKGWHKRFFLLDKGILYYGKNSSDIQKGKYHGVIDTGLSFMAFKKHRHRIDIDAEDLIYHIKIKKNFDEWLNRLRQHRLYRQHEISFGTKESPRLTEISSPLDNIAPIMANMNLPEKVLDKTLTKQLSRHSSVKGQDRVATWVLDTQGFEQCNKGLSTAQNLLYELNKDLEAIRNLPLNGDSFDLSDMESSDKKKSKYFVGRSSKRKDHKRNASLQSNEPRLLEVKKSEVHSSQPPTPVTTDVNISFNMQDLSSSASNPNLVSQERPRPTSDPVNMSPVHQQKIDDLKLREGFVSKADEIYKSLQGVLHSMMTEKERLKHSVETQNVATSSTSISPAVVALKQTLADVCQQNRVLKGRLAKIHNDSSLTDIQISSPPGSPLDKRIPSGLTQSFSAESCSMSEYYDAEEENNLALLESLSESSSEHSDEEASSDISDDFDTELSTAQSASEDNLLTSFKTGRRSKLPVPKPDGGDISLWNLLFRNIGKDLTKISMPVTLNQPLSMLQRLCEDLEYSDLLDKANDYDDPYERMVYLAAFAVSSYAQSSYRLGNKPFNPLLGETYECIREDKGWRFVAEQVSHHPPISACYCDSKTFKLWHDVQIKTKFWGKSMEIQPLGQVNVQLPKYGDHYRWNKVTTCVHNILGGQRWVDQFGEMTITNGSIVCKLTFPKASHYYQSDKRHEVFGTIMNQDGKIVHNLFGLWNEALYCGHSATARCIWRPGSMPEDYELYYGFTRFAIELNEILPDESKFLPPTDSRFRPDQRLLEEGNVAEAEKEKVVIENLQRERRKHREATKEEYRPFWFKKESVKGKDTFVYDNRYWECRKEPGFLKMTLPRLW